MTLVPVPLHEVEIYVLNGWRIAAHESLCGGYVHMTPPVALVSHRVSEKKPGRIWKCEPGRNANSDAGHTQRTE